MEMDEVAEAVILRVPGSDPTSLEGVYLVESWTNLKDSLTDEQQSVTAATYEARCANHSVLPMLDRNKYTAPWRRVFVVRDEENSCVYVFGENGEAIDEPDCGVTAGKQLLHGDEGTFLEDFKQGFYAVEGAQVEEFAEPDELDEQHPQDTPGGDEQQEPFVVDERIKKGARLAIAFDELWEGCVVDEVLAEPLAALLAFDDGDLKLRMAEQIREDLSENCLKFIGAGGMVQSIEEVPAAVRAARYKDGSSAARAVGVLVGAMEHTLAGDALYESFFVDPDAFSQRDGGATRRAAAVPTLQDRLGFHTLRRGDVVEYVHLDESEQCRAAVFGVTWPDANAGRKYLVLQEITSLAFFVAGYTDWRRKHTRSDADIDDNSTAEMLSVEALEKMLAAWASSNKLAHLDSTKKVANATRNLPPHLKEQRAEAARIAKEKKAAAAKAAGKGAAGKKLAGKGGRGGKKGGRGRGQLPSPEESSDDDLQPLNARIKRGRNRPPPTDPAALAAEAQARAQAARLAELEEALRASQAAVKAAKLAAGAPPKPPTLPPTNPLPAMAPAAAGAAAPPGLPPPPPTLPPGWRSSTDGAGRVYYFNKNLGKSTYDLPEAESPPLPPPSTPGSAPSRRSQSSHGSSSSAVAAPFEVEQRRDRIVKIRGMLEYCDNRQDKVELNGELAVLMRQESQYVQSRGSSSRLSYL